MSAALTSLSTSYAVDGPGEGRLYDVDGVRLYATVSGQGPPIVFLHGGLSDFDNTFAAQKTYFAAFRTVVGVDQRGHGHSPDNGSPFSYRQMADDTAALIQRLGLRRVDVVGFSDGGNVGLLLARYYPQLVRRLVISGANTRGDSSGLYYYARFRLSSAPRFAASVPPPLRRRYDAVSPDGDVHWPTFVAKTKALWETWTVMRAADLKKITIPVLVMAGDHDAIALEHTMMIYRELPRGQLSILPGAGHQVLQERPEDFNRLVREFLEAPISP